MHKLVDPSKNMLRKQNDNDNYCTQDDEEADILTNERNSFTEVRFFFVDLFIFLILIYTEYLISRLYLFIIHRYVLSSLFLRFEFDPFNCLCVNIRSKSLNRWEHHDMTVVRVERFLIQHCRFPKRTCYLRSTIHRRRLTFCIRNVFL